MLPCDRGEKFNCALVDKTEKTILVMSIENISSCDTIEFNNEGSLFLGAECLLFPSEEVRDWNLFQVKYVKTSGVKETDDKLKRLLDIDHPRLNAMEFLPDTILYRGRLDNEVYSNRANDEEYNFILATGKELKTDELNSKI